MDDDDVASNIYLITLLYTRFSSWNFSIIVDAPSPYRGVWKSGVLGNDPTAARVKTRMYFCCHTNKLLLLLHVFFFT